MKHLIKTFASIFLLTVALLDIAHAQDGMVTASIPTSYNNSFASKDEKNNKTESAVSEVVTAKFAALYPAASGQLWAATADHCYVSFLNNGRKAKASFTTGGKLNYVITDCSMENLTASFLETIASKYASYQLFNAIQMRAYGTVAYQAMIENSKGFITLKYCGDGVEEMQQVRKQ